MKEKTNGRVATRFATEAEREAVAAFLQPIIDATRDVYGSRIRLTELLSQHIGAQVSRRTIHRWLSDDEDARMEPKLGLALVMMKVFKENRRAICAPWQGGERRAARSANTKHNNTKGKSGDRNKNDEKKDRSKTGARRDSNGRTGSRAKADQEN